MRSQIVALVGAYTTNCATNAQVTVFTSVLGGLKPPENVIVQHRPSPLDPKNLPTPIHPHPILDLLSNNVNFKSVKWPRINTLLQDYDSCFFRKSDFLLKKSNLIRIL